MLEYKSINTRSGNVGYVEIGEGLHTLVLIVGYSGTLFHWNASFINELAKHYKLYLIDNRKIGLSSSSNPDSIHGLGEDVIDFIDAMKLDKPAILGWSMGGVVVQELLKMHQEKISKVVLLATVPAMEHVSPMFFKLIAEANNYCLSEFKQKLYYFFFSDDKHDGIKDSILNGALPLKNYHYRFNNEARALQDAIIPVWQGINAKELSEIKSPVLLLWAKNDLVVSEKAINFLAANLPLSKKIIYQTGGHFLIQDNSVQIAKDILDFLFCY